MEHRMPNDKEDRPPGKVNIWLQNPKARPMIIPFGLSKDRLALLFKLLGVRRSLFANVPSRLISCFVIVFVTDENFDEVYNEINRATSELLALEEQTPEDGAPRPPRGRGRGHGHTICMSGLVGPDGCTNDKCTGLHLPSLISWLGGVQAIARALLSVLRFQLRWGEDLRAQSPDNQEQFPGKDYARWRAKIETLIERYTTEASREMEPRPMVVHNIRNSSVEVFAWASVLEVFVIPGHSLEASSAAEISAAEIYTAVIANSMATFEGDAWGAGEAKRLAHAWRNAIDSVDPTTKEYPNLLYIPGVASQFDHSCMRALRDSNMASCENARRRRAEAAAAAAAAAGEEHSRLGGGRLRGVRRWGGRLRGNRLLLQDVIARICSEVAHPHLEEDAHQRS